MSKWRFQINGSQWGDGFYSYRNFAVKNNLRIVVKICQFVRLMAKFFDVSRLKVNPIKTLLVSKVHLVTEMDNLTKFRQTVWMFMDFGKFLVKFVEAKSAWGIWRFWRIFAIFVNACISGNISSRPSVIYMIFLKCFTKNHPW